jgi:hypothetical protein
MRIFLQYIVPAILLLIPIRQFKGEYFYYFLFTGLDDGITTFILRDFLNTNSNSFYISFGLLTLFFLLNKEIFKKYILFFGAIFIVTSIIDWNVLLPVYNIYLTGLIHLLIFLLLLQRLIIGLIIDRKFYLFLFLIIFCELTTISKYITIISGISGSYTFFYTTTIFETFIGIIFLIFREDNPLLIFNLNNDLLVESKKEIK